MKKVIMMAAAVLLVSTTACDKYTKKGDLKTAMDSVCYAIGVSYGSGFAEQLKTLPTADTTIKANKEAMIAAFAQALRGDSTILNAEQAQAFIQEYFTKQQQLESSKNLTEGENFLAENKSKEGVITTASGLQYKVIKEGSGEKPTADNQVKVHYTGKTLDGKVFDSSVERGEPATFGVGQVIPGWTEALQLMTPGSKYELWIPAALAYGERGAGGDIKPNAVLNFDVELIEILPAEKK